MRIVKWRTWTGTGSSSGPKVTTASASRAGEGAVPMIAGCHPRTIETARSVVNASTISTIDARNNELTTKTRVGN